MPRPSLLPLLAWTRAVSRVASMALSAEAGLVRKWGRFAWIGGLTPSPTPDLDHCRHRQYRGLSKPGIDRQVQTHRRQLPPIALPDPEENAKCFADAGKGDPCCLSQEDPR